MKSYLLSLTFIAMLLFLASCEKIKGKGDVVSQMRTVEGYTGIRLTMDGDVYFTPDSVYKLEILAQQNIIDVIETPIEGGHLVIKLKDHTILGKHEPVRFNISAPDISYFDISGSGSFHLTGSVDEPTIDVIISGSGNTNASEIITNRLNVNISGSGNISAAGGTADYEYLTISGSGNIELENVVADTVYANISGSGDIRVNVTKFLDGTISGSGNIHYRGTPVISSHISGSGSISPL